jgi:L-arabinose isomerase
MANNNLKHILLLGASQDLYGDKILADVDSKMAAIASSFSSSGVFPCPVRFGGVGVTKDDIEERVRKINADPDCAGVVIHAFTFSPGQQWSPLKGLNKPLCHLNTWWDLDIQAADLDMDRMNEFQAAHGDIELSNGLDAHGIRRHGVYGHWQDGVTQAKLGDWARVALAVDRIRNKNVITIGGRMTHVVGTEMPSNALSNALGVGTINVSESEFASLLPGVSDHEVQARLKFYEERFTIHETARRRYDILENAARQEVVVGRLLQKENAIAWTSHFNRLNGLGQLPALAAQISMINGIGYGPEGDIGVAVLGTVAALLSKDGIWSLHEPYVRGNGEILGSHMAEVSPALFLGRKQDLSLQVHHLSIGDASKELGGLARVVFPSSALPEATQASFVYRDGETRIIAATATVAGEAGDRFPKLPVGRALVVPPGGSAGTSRFLACAQRAGISHHDILSTVKTWELFAHMTGITFAGIDERTTPGEVRAQLFQQKIEGAPLQY